MSDNLKKLTDRTNWAEHHDTTVMFSVEEACRIRDELAALRERVRVLEEAARPIAAYARTFHPNWVDDIGTDGSNDGTCPTHGDYRRLAAALAQPPAGGANDE